MKNHILVDGRLLQTNKIWSQLKERQKAWIGELLRNEYMRLAQDVGRPLHKDEYGVIVSRVYEQIEKREIWIPFNEVRRYFSAKVARYRKSFQNTQKEMRKTSLNERLNIAIKQALTRHASADMILRYSNPAKEDLEETVNHLVF